VSEPHTVRCADVQKDDAVGPQASDLLGLQAGLGQDEVDVLAQRGRRGADDAGGAVEADGRVQDAQPPPPADALARPACRWRSPGDPWADRLAVHTERRARRAPVAPSTQRPSVCGTRRRAARVARRAARDGRIGWRSVDRRPAPAARSPRKPASTVGPSTRPRRPSHREREAPGTGRARDAHCVRQVHRVIECPRRRCV
jgi:hypothetical protein